MSKPFLADRPDAAGSPALRRALVLLWLVSAPVLCLLWLKVEPSPDQAQFDYMGWMATMGQPFYAGSFDMNWPGGMLLHEAAIRLFGPVLWSWHMLDFLLMQCATIAAAVFLWRERPRRPLRARQPAACGAPLHPQRQRPPAGLYPAGADDARPRAAGFRRRRRHRERSHCRQGPGCG